jgi:hypothetical protein
MVVSEEHAAINFKVYEGGTFLQNVSKHLSYFKSSQPATNQLNRDVSTLQNICNMKTYIRKAKNHQAKAFIEDEPLFGGSSF